MTIKAFPSPRMSVGRGMPLSKDEPQTIGKLFLSAAAHRSRPDALNYKHNNQWQPISSQEMIERAGNIALGLVSLGINKEDRVAILAANSPEWTLTDAGCQFAGVVDVPIYTTLAPEAVAYILRDSGSRLLFVDSQEAYDRISVAIADCPELERVIFFDAKAAGKNSSSLDDLIDKGKRLRSKSPDLLSQLTEAVEPDDIATLIYTSGTTGEPKGVMLTQTNIISNVIDAGEKYDFTVADASLSVLPLSHVFERSAMYLYIYNGMSVNYAESIDKVPDNLLEVRPTIFVGVPRIFEKVYAKAKLKAATSGGVKEQIFDWAIDIAKETAYKNEQREPLPASLSLKYKLADILIFSKLRQFFGGNLRFCITGGAALSDEIYLIFTGAGIGIMQGYGLTETSPVLSSNNPYAQRLGTVGKPIRNVQIRVAEDGEVEAAGPGIMFGYYNKEAATRDTFTSDGWFRTGDIGELDKDGYLKITDRKKELFKTSGGKYIAPSPIEQRIKASRFVNQVVLVGNERKFAAALIVPNFEMLESYAAIKGFSLNSPAEFCSDAKIHDLFERQIAEVTKGLSRYETVKKFALLENELTVDGGELTPTLKVKRRVIDQKYKAIIDRLYQES